MKHRDHITTKIIVGLLGVICVAIVYLFFTLIRTPSQEYNVNEEAKVRAKIEKVYPDYDIA